MVLNLVVPELSSRPAATKDAVISILTLEWPLSLRGIFHKIKKQYGYSASYQAVFKAVKELCSLNVLSESDRKYQINIEWVKKVQSFTDIVETNYYAKERVLNLAGLKETRKKGDILVMNFDTVFDAEKYLYYLMKSALFKSKDDTVCCQFANEWRPIFYLRSEYNYYRRLQQRGHKFYFMCSGNSYLEKLSGKFYRSIGVNYKHTRNKYSNDILVFDDYYITIFIPCEFRRKMQALLEKQDVMKLLFEVLDSKSSVRLVVTRDKGLAEDVKKQCLGMFGGNK